MHQSSRLVLAAAAMALASSSAALAQTAPPSPMPMSTGSSSSPTTPQNGVMTMPPMSPTGASTSAPSSMPASTTAPSSGGSSSGGSSGGSMNGGGSTGGSDINGHIKTIKNGSLTRSQVVYGLTHQIQAAKQLAKMKTVNFDNLRVYKLPTSLKTMLKVSDADTQAIALAILGNGVQVAQASPAPSMPSSNGNNSPIQFLHNVLANINVSNALNNLNVLNNSNVNLNVALSNVLNNNKISIGQVVGLYIGGGGIITTITK